MGGVTDTVLTANLTFGKLIFISFHMYKKSRMLKSNKSEQETGLMEKHEVMERKIEYVKELYWDINR